MVNRIRTIYSRGLNEGFSLNSKVQYETPEEGWRMYQLKCVYNNKDEDNILNILSDKD